MSFVTTGLLVSFFLVLTLSVLFSYEERTEKRFLGRARAHADIFVLAASRRVHEMLRFVIRDLVRQVARYTFHKVLSGVLFVLRELEEALKNAIRTNKTLAKSVEEESEVRSKLEEIAFHKAANALSEEEKRLHRDKMLEG